MKRNSRSPLLTLLGNIVDHYVEAQYALFQNHLIQIDYAMELEKKELK